MPRAKRAPLLTPEEQTRRERAIARQKAAKDEEKQILAGARERARKTDRRISALIGVAIRSEVENDPARKAELIALLTRFYTRENERRALEAYGVPPLLPPTAQAEQIVTPPDTPAPSVSPVPVSGFGGDVRMVRH